MGDCTVTQPRGSWRTTPCPASTTTSPASLSRGRRRNLLTRTPGPFPTCVFTKAELLGYIDYCRGRVRSNLFDALTGDDAAAQPLPGAHRYDGTLFGVVVGSIPVHIIEHASQIRQFLTAAGIKQQQSSD